ncbi:helix-turn-helix domain-containing protein [Chryseosolibacter indicus]|uniref:AraC family transcriptional regulator n=1 Tax=Chryseosolibacter indicus TaxID=2782351 RepID=A0ABS5VYG0_9BACT|nr:helix-turn-helix domain-containing protein [Chryseosolibacter indicus]MBT1706103.1 AraC family transcriptional regulator [Chryseosolibacter indicus]
MINEANQYIRSERISVPDEFKDVFSHFYIAENHSLQAVQKTLLPSFQIMLVFNFGPPVIASSSVGNEIVIESCLVVGPIKKTINYTLPPHAELLVANFIGDSFYRFFTTASNEFLALHPDLLLGENCFSAVWQCMKDLPSVEQRLHFLLDFSRQYLRQKDDTVEKILSMEYNSSAYSVVKAVANETSLSERSVQLKYKKFLGYTAKEMARYQRFMKAIAFVQSKAVMSENIDWADVVERFGYYDQSQLIHDFQHFVNLSPKNYVALLKDICSARGDKAKVKT